MDVEKRFEELIGIMIRNAVSDLHITCGNTCVLEGRNGKSFVKIDGKPEDRNLLPFLQYISNMDISAYTKPQSGAFIYKYRGKTYSFRFAYLVSGNVKSGVLRLLNYDKALPLEQLVRNAEHRKIFQNWLTKDHGLILITGPTGAGKTTTAYSLAGNMRGRKVYSLEDPVEVHFREIVQIQVNGDSGLTYADGIRQLLRHDPDVIMIGEIRDEETAHMALRCALTGHLVISTIHSSACKNAIIRLRDLGISEYDLQDVLEGIANQRLYNSNPEGKRISLYEVYSKTDLEMYFKDPLYPHETLEDERKNALRKGWIQDAESV